MSLKVKSNGINFNVPTIENLPTERLEDDLVCVVTDENRGGVFVYRAANALVNNGGTIFNGWTRQYDGAVNVKWFGAVGDGVNDDTAALNNSASLGVPVYIPHGTFIFSSPLTFTDNVYCDGAKNTILKYAGGDNTIAITFDGGHKTIEAKNFTLLSVKVAGNLGRTGIYDKGSVNNSFENILVQEFDIGLKIGDSVTNSGSYWASYKNIRIKNNIGIGSYGVYISSSSSGRNSNDNIFLNVTVSGEYTVPYFIGGNNNLFIAGGAEATSGVAIASIYEFDGSENKIISPYVEYTTNKPILATFTSLSNNNKIEDVNSIYTPNGSLDGFISDLGTNNKVNVTGLGYQDFSLSDNLFLNADFTHWRSATAPWGFTDTTGASKDTTTTFNGAHSSLKFTCAANTITANAYVDSSSVNSVFKYNINKFLGKEVVFSVYCKTALTQSVGIKATAVSPTGNQNITSGKSFHTGNGEWQKLSMMFTLKPDITLFILSLTSSMSTTAQTGDIYWCYPELRTRESKASVPVLSEKPYISSSEIMFNNTLITNGTGTPQGVITAPVGSMYMRLDGGANTTLYIKESGTGNTGWVAK